MKIIKPTSNYRLVLPDDIHQRAEGRVSSFWIDGEPLLLQTSSYVRELEPQEAAIRRLQDRIAKHKEKWRIWNEPIAEDVSLDQAIGEFIDRDGLLWIHAYFSCPHLTVYATVSGPPETIRNGDNWALKSLREIRLNVR